MKHLWKVFILIGSIGLVYSLLQFHGSSTGGMFGAPEHSSFGIDKPFDLIGAVSVGLIVLGLLQRKK